MEQLSEVHPPADLDLFSRAQDASYNIFTPTISSHWALDSTKRQPVLHEKWIFFLRFFLLFQILPIWEIAEFFSISWEGGGSSSSISMQIRKCGMNPCPSDI